MVLTVDGQDVPTNPEGFLLDAAVWSPQIAEALADRENLQLSDAHWEILWFIRDYYQKYQHLPNARMFAAAIRKQMGEAKAASRYLQNLFPQGPLKYACKIAGLPKPPTCL
ncbi:TusE/DsrC/DsvC family sulfur relay protein [Methylomonas paludis]|uniref:Sulfurtransferase n=1 Tax=Methylomonas paludis TaxID=1173101 RepID=A0A975MP84_9GAMM|nr:TusE/DsrC/DsvC family sulfur relay protein [Methylomonas paludis]QWF71503.1 TusE/DsrC/DsvC family sulfur relay protein [Methylomonas paludis]